MQHAVDFLKLVEEYRPLVKETDVAHVKSKLDAKDKFMLIDVREDHEWAQGHIPQAIHMGRGVIERDIEKSIPQMETEIILYCGGGFRSILAAVNLQKMGYTNVVSMDGGIKDWLNHGYKLEV